VDVLVGIVSKNRAAILPSAIDSALNQKDVSVKVAVFDNDSDDGTKLMGPRYPQVDWEFSSENKGYVFARNKFMATADATYFCSLDDDSWFTDDHSLAKGVRYLEKNPKVAAIAYDILSPDRPDAIPEGEPHEVNTFIGCGHLVRLSNAREIGLYDVPPAYYGGEEKDLCLKLINKGYQIIKLPGVHVWHEKTSVARDPFAQHRSGVCNDLVYAWKRLPVMILLPVISWKIISHRRFAKKYGNGEYLNACKQGIHDFFVVLKQGKISRQPVSFKALRHFQNLSGA
jgi:GT2 family glycosyltransferase